MNVLTLIRPVALLAAACAIAACSAGSPLHGHTAGSPKITVAPLRCHQIYEQWKHGQAAGPLKSFDATVKAVQSAGAADDFPRLRSALVSAGKAARRLAAHKVPRCADPAGNYASLLTRIEAAGDNARSAAGLSGLILAEVPLKTVSAIERRLKTELNSAVGKHR